MNTDMNSENQAFSDTTADPSRTIIVRKYGLLPPTDWDSDVLQQLKLQNQFWNKLVEIDRAHTEKYRAVIGSDEEVAAIETRIAAIRERKAALLAERKNLRKAVRSKVKADTGLIDEEIRGLTEEIRRLAPEAKERRAAAKAALNGVLATLEIERRALVKTARQDFAKLGLWWCNYNAVLDSFNVARIRALKEKANLRFHRFDGSGRLVNQIQGGMSLDDLFAGAHSQVKLVSPPPDAFTAESRGERRRLQRTLLTVTAYTGVDQDGNRTRRTLTFPLVMHRPFPDNATIKIVAVNRKKLGGTYRWSVAFTCSMPSGVHPGHPEPTLACGANLGWKQVEGGLRVATVAGNDGLLQHIVLPDAILSGFDRVETLKSRLDSLANEVHASLLDRIREVLAETPEGLIERLQKLQRAKQPNAGRLIALASYWRREFPHVLPKTVEWLKSERKRLTQIKDEMDNLRDKLIARRDNEYRNAAKRIADRYGLIALDDYDLRRAAELETPSGEENELPPVARANRQRAAVSILRHWLGLQAVKTGTRIVRVAIPSTRTCADCGALTMEGKPSELTWTCTSCGVSRDQDENAGLNLLRVAAESASAPVVA